MTTQLAPPFPGRLARGGAIVGGDALQYAEWLFGLYMKQLRLDDVVARRACKKYLKTFVPDMDTFGMSGVSRSLEFLDIKFGYPLRRSGYTVAAFSAATGASKSIYAYLYWPINSSAPEYICISHSFDSKDGEYRYRFNRFVDYLKLYEKHSSVFSPIEAAVITMIKNKKLVLDINFTASQDTHVDYVTHNRLSLKLFVIALVLDYIPISHNIMQNHANKEYILVLSNIYQNIPKIILAILLTKNGGIILGEFVPADDELMCGQKLYPLTIRESIQTDDINFSVWREIWINRKTTDLVINAIAPSFPIYDNWTIIDGIDVRSFFDNKDMHKKFKKSAKAEKIMRHLSEARGETETTDYYMAQFDHRIYESIEYAQSYLLMSGVVVCSVSEYVGLTPKSFATLLENGPVSSATTNPALRRVFEDGEMCARYMFDLCYGALAAHTRCHVAHTDIHQNNITIRLAEELARFSYKGGKWVEHLKGPTIAYILDPLKADKSTYVFAHDGIYACIIDYSRGVVGPAARGELGETHGKTYAKDFYRAQISRSLATLAHYLPVFVQKHQEKIKGLLLASPEAMFRVLTAVDFLAIGRSFSYIYDDINKPALLSNAPPEGGPKKNPPLRAPKDAVDRARRLEKAALEFLVTRLSDLMEKGEPDSTPFAGDEVIPLVFADYSYERRAAAGKKNGLAGTFVTDIYNIRAPLAYSSEEYAKFPPWARVDVLEKHLFGLDISEVMGDRGEEPFLNSLKSGQHFDVLRERLQEQVKDRPSDPSSSWLPE